MYESSGVREIHQGDFIISEDHVHGMEYKPLLDAWTAWQQKLDKCELLYRFGDPLSNGDKHVYPNLAGWFKKFGENQAEFSLRLYQLLKKVFEENDNHLDVIIGHQASCSRIQRIFDAISKLNSPSQFECGHFVKFLEKKGNRATVEPATGLIVKKPDSDLAIEVLNKEIQFLETIV